MTPAAAPSFARLAPKSLSSPSKTKMAMHTGKHMVLVMGIIIAWASSLRAQEFFSIDCDADELVRIDVSTGNVTTIGSLGDDVGSTSPGAQMTWYRGKLLAILRDRYSNGRLVDIDPTSGSILKSDPTIMAGLPAVGESLFVYNGDLHMSADPNHDSRSEKLAGLSLDGSMVQVADFGPVPGDLDGLVQDHTTGTTYNLDSDGGTSAKTTLFEATISPPSLTTIKLYPNPLRAHDPVIIGDLMYAIAHTVPRIVVIDLAPGTVGDLLADIPLNTTHLLLGLAPVDPSYPGFAYCFGDPGNGTPCPCSNDNDGSVPGSGCANGVFASGAQLTASGIASVSNDTLVLATTHLEPNNSGLYFQAQNDLSPGIAWGDGLRCAGADLIRLQVRFADAAGTSNTTIGISAKAANILAGNTKYYQCWYRNPNGSPCGSDFNASNGYAITWLP